MKNFKGVILDAKESDNLLKVVSDMTFRAEQSIASGGTRTLLFGMM